MPQPPPTSAARFGLDQLVHRPMRADARRNYDALLAAADELFTTHGPDVALDEIARRAGVGNATLYRHFPDRRDLLVAVCVGEVEALCILGEELEADPDPGRALARWLRAYVEHVSAKHGLAAAFATGRREDSELVAACQAAVEAIGTSLLQRAKNDGPVRIESTSPTSSPSSTPSLWPPKPATTPQQTEAGDSPRRHHPTRQRPNQSAHKS